MKTDLKKINPYKLIKGVVLLENPLVDLSSNENREKLLGRIIVRKYKSFIEVLNPSLSTGKRDDENVRKDKPNHQVHLPSMTRSQCEEHLKIIKKIEDELIRCVKVEKVADASGKFTTFFNVEEFTRLYNLLSEWKGIEPFDRDIPLRDQFELALIPEKMQFSWLQSENYFLFMRREPLKH